MYTLCITSAFPMFRGMNVLFACYIAFLLQLLVFQTCHSSTITAHCAPSSCGNIQNISYPFRLNTDPQSCGNYNYTLICENNISTVLYLYSGKYYVQAIDYGNFTIRVVDASVQDNCSIPRYSLAPDNFSDGDRYSWYNYKEVPPGVNEGSVYYQGVWLTTLSQPMIFMSCENTVNSTLYVDTAPYSLNNGSVNCSNSTLVTRSNYVTLGGMDASDLMELCTIEKIFLLPKKNYTDKSFEEIRSDLAYGFELSWYNINCENCTLGCYIDSSDRRQCIALHNGLKVVCGTPCVIIFLIYKWRRRHLSVYDTVEQFLQGQNNLMPVRYSYSDIKKITKGFKEKLGEGGFGTVYKGKLRSGRFAAVKLLGKSKANGQDFINEVATIGRIHHTNVVQLIGFCAEGSKRALVYDFMPNGSLDRHLFSREGSISLSWQKLHQISLGVARGIDYLHLGCDMQILHFDIKPHNILLDENFTPKVSDFGLARLYPTNGSITSLTAARGTIGYMAPELFYKNIGRVSYKADVYSFGMLLLEMAGKRKNVNALAENSSEIYWPYWVHDQVSDGKAIEIGDDATEEERKIVKKMIMVGLWCIQMKPMERPTMKNVVEMLEGDLENLQLPPKPVFNLDVTPPNIEGESSSLSGDSTASTSLIENAY
ncbi:rust resistance kinase Lr10-like [Populus alba x Populus x berolinensis]|uniref:Rust resistance kinase Lr10-like n=1 Tax=Populus alba x Populus x berolinensis TaxID=444605 RepID=A0AAD6LHB4_9ROSI|nr:rust resistance kinase Lr10-like [Populus alba x Populus x berolinensis]